MFNYDPKLLPEVKLDKEWKLTDGTINQLYRVGNWTLELPEEGDIEYVEGAIYAWIAWHNFLINKENNN